MPAVVRAGIEMAFLDAAGKALNRPVYTLLGGKVRDRIESAASSLPVPQPGWKTGRWDSAQAMLDRAQELVARYGFRVLKFKGGVLPPNEELAALRLLKKHMPGSPLRWDPNAAWSVETSIRIGRRLLDEQIDLEYLEDPPQILKV